MPRPGALVNADRTERKVHVETSARWVLPAPQVKTESLANAALMAEQE